MDIPTATTPATTTATPAAAPALTAIQVAIADLTQALENLTRSIQVNAVPADPPLTTTAQGTTQLTLLTQSGDITVTLPQLSATEQQTLLQTLQTLIQTQRPLTLTIQPGSPPTQGVLLIPTPPPAATTTAPQQTAPPAQALPPPPVSVGEDLPAIVLPSSVPPPVASLPAAPPLQTQPPPSPPSQTAPPASLPEEIPVPPASVNEPVPAAASSPPPAVPIPTTPAPPAPVATTPAAPPPLSALLQPGNDVSLHVDAIVTANQKTPPLAPNQIVATVTGTAPGGQLILKAGDVTLFIKAPVAAAPGTQLVLSVDALKPAPLLTLASNDPTNFPSLPQIVTALAQADPQALQQMLTRLPQPNAQLPGTLMLLFGAFRQADPRGMLGDNAASTLMRMGKPELIAALARDLGGSGQVAQDAVVGEWRTYPIPLYSGQAFQALTLYVHDGAKDRQGRQSGAAQAPGKIRFVIDMRLSKLGAMQLDGFVQPKKLDMILRSEHGLPEGLHQHLRGAYIKAMGAVGFAGSLNFQVGRNHWMVMNKARSEMVT
ncbi:MAG: hypothetical protein P4M15_12360 [Alphaproteobacteria bacterium]|nr:hypothetical protein [Alphaproteobacteria bacterium]